MIPTSDGEASKEADSPFITFSEAELREWAHQLTKFDSEPVAPPQAEIDELLAGLDDSPEPDAPNTAAESNR